MKRASVISIVAILTAFLLLAVILMSCVSSDRSRYFSYVGRKSDVIDEIRLPSHVQVVMVRDSPFTIEAVSGRRSLTIVVPERDSPLWVVIGQMQSNAAGHERGFVVAESTSPGFRMVARKHPVFVMGEGGWSSEERKAIAEGILLRGE